MKGSEAFGGCLIIIAVGFLASALGGATAGLYGGLFAAFAVGVVLFVQVQKAKRSDERTQAPPAPPMSQPPASAQATLEELERLRAAGLISSEEYAAKRARVLENL